MFNFRYHFRWICRLCDMEHSSRIIRCNASSKLIGTRLSITSVSSVTVRPATPGGGSPEETVEVPWPGTTYGQPGKPSP